MKKYIIEAKNIAMYKDHIVFKQEVIQEDETLEQLAINFLDSIDSGWYNVDIYEENGKKIFNRRYDNYKKQWFRRY